MSSISIVGRALDAVRLRGFWRRGRTSLRAWRHVAFLAATLIAVPLVGYHFGTFDQSIHIPFLRAFADPSLYPGDEFLSLRHHSYSFFWFMLLPFYRWGMLEPVMFALHLAFTYATFWAIWTLAETLFDDPRVSLLSVSAMVFPHIGFAGFPVVEFSLLARTAVLPFLLWAIVLHLRGRTWQAFVLLGLLYNLHVISVNFVLAMFGMDVLLRWRETKWGGVVIGSMGFLIAALPVLWWRMSSAPPGIGATDEWLQLVTEGVLGNIFHLLSPHPHILAGTIGGISGLALFATARGKVSPGPHDRAVGHFHLATVGLIGVQVVLGEWLRVPLVIQLQLVRVGTLSMIFGFVYFARLLVDALDRRALDGQQFRLLSAALAISPLALVPLGGWWLRRAFANEKWRMALGTFGLVAFFAVSGGYAIQLGAWKPGLYPFGPSDEWRDVQEWARSETDRTAVFITPPEIMGFFTPDWRVFSERATVVTFNELLYAAYVPGYEAHWSPRFEELAPGVVAQFRGNYLDNLAKTGLAFHSHDTAALIDIGARYGAEFLVVPTNQPRDLPEIYRNERYLVYRLPISQGEAGN